MTLTVVVVLIVGGFLSLCGLLVIRNVIYICQPNEVLIFSGGARKVGSRVLGYRLVRGGRGIRVPLLEEVNRLDLTNMIIELQASAAYAKGGIPLNVQAVANIKIAGDEPVICNAIERFLGKPRAVVMRIAKETLEGNLRGVLASLTPEQVNEDKQAFEELLLSEAEVDLEKLGLRLDSLKLQNIYDDVGYLDSIGRCKTAELQTRSRSAEAKNHAKSVIQEATNQQETAVAQIDAQILVAKAAAARRVRDAITKREAVIAEERAQVGALVAKAHAEMEYQSNRYEQVKRQLDADVIQPAIARRRQLEEQARSNSVNIAENGRASAEALREVARMWVKGGPYAREIFMTQKIDTLVNAMVGTMKNIRVDKVTLIDGSVKDVDKHGSMPMKVASATEQIKQTLGVDVPALAKGFSASFSST